MYRAPQDKTNADTHAKCFSVPCDVLPTPKRKPNTHPSSLTQRTAKKAAAAAADLERKKKLQAAINEKRAKLAAEKAAKK